MTRDQFNQFTLFRYNGTQLSITHNYSVVNNGPSMSNGDLNILFLLPFEHKSTLVPLSDNVLCSNDSTINKNIKRCNSKRYKVFSCTIPKHWQKGESKEFVINMNFSTKITEDGSSIHLCTAALFNLSGKSSPMKY